MRIFFSVIVICSIISGCNGKRLSDNIETDIMKVMPSAEQMEDLILPIDKNGRTAISTEEDSSTASFDSQADTSDEELSSQWEQEQLSDKSLYELLMTILQKTHQEM